MSQQKKPKAKELTNWNVPEGHGSPPVVPWKRNSYTKLIACVQAVAPNATRLSLWFDAPGNQWTEFGFSIWNDGDSLTDKLYLVYPYEPGEYVDTGESVTATFHNAEFQHPFGWNYVDRGQVDFEFYAPGRVKGWFHLVMPSNVPRDPEVEDITISGTFDTPYTTSTR